MADFMRMKNGNTKMKQSEIANHLGYSSTLQRYRNDVMILLPCRTQSNTTIKRTKEVSITNFNNNSCRKPELKRFQTTSIDLETAQTNTKSNKRNKNNLKVGSVHENVEINEHYLDEILHKKHKKPYKWN